jgi:hypothetical protein
MSWQGMREVVGQSSGRMGSKKRSGWRVGEKRS